MLVYNFLLDEVYEVHVACISVVKIDRYASGEDKDPVGMRKALDTVSCIDRITKSAPVDLS